MHREGVFVKEKGCLSRRRGVCQGEGVHCVEVSVDESLFVT